MSDLVSVIVPVYNVEKYLAECIKSILQQSYDNIELILVNDGSPDSSGEICESFSKTDSRIKVLHIENQGVANARNQGMSLASGKYITFIDSDDIITPDLVEAMVSTLEKYDADYVNGAFAKYINGKIANTLDYFTDKGDAVSVAEYLDRMSEYQAGAFWGGVCTKLFKKQIIDENKLFYEKDVLFAEDFRFNLEYLKHVKKVALIHKPMYLYRIDTLASLSKRKRDAKKFWNEYYEIYKRFIELYTLKNVYDENSKKLFRFLINAREEVLRYCISKNKELPHELNKTIEYINTFDHIKDAEKVCNNTVSSSSISKWIYIIKLYLMDFRIRIKKLIKH